MTTTSVLIRKQEKKFTAEYVNERKENSRLVATVRYDDSCGNGHNSFAITGELRKGSHVSGGCIHDEIAERLPELAPFIKWHLCSSDGPMHYVANTAYHVEQGKLDYARSSAIWPEATDEELTAPGLEDRLLARLPKLMEDFRQAVESFGFTY